MNVLMKKIWVGGFALALATGMAAAQTDDPNDLADQAAKLQNDVARLKKEIQHANADLQHTDSLTRDENAAAAQNLDRWQKDRERRQKENQDLTARIQATRTKIAAEQSRMQSYVNEAGEIKAQEQSLLQVFSVYADSIVARINNGLPWDVDVRKDRVLSLKRDLEAGSATPEEAFGRLAAIFKEETKNGDEVALFNRPLTRQNGEVINAQILKLGNQALMYMDDENKQFGILEQRMENGKPVYAWREDLSFEDKKSIKLALGVKAGREAPQLIPLNLALSLEPTSTGGHP